MISVIIPVYNAEKTLNRCIDSLLLQGTALELVFVNDASKDNSKELILSRAKDIETASMKYKIIDHEQNRGVAAARNTGLDNATGEYIYWVDSDDYLSENTLSRAMENIQKENLDIALLDFYITFAENERAMRLPDVLSSQDAFEKMCKGVLKWNLWLYIIRRSAIESRKLRFVEKQNMGEDLMFLGSLLQDNLKIKSLHEMGYHYIRTNEGAMTQNYNPAFYAQVSENLKLLQKNTKDENQYLLDFLKLNLKLPLLISENKENYIKWTETYPESDILIWKNDFQPLRTKMLQFLASKKQYWAISIYNKVLLKIIYGIIYK